MAHSPPRAVHESLSALDDLSATEELGEAASRASVMDELDAILGDVQTVRAVAIRPSRLI